jgi:protein gp37
MQRSKIAWTDATWNPVTGCSKVSPGCANCYAERFAERFRGVAGHPFEHGFDLQLRPERLDEPLHWRKPRRVFVCSMADLFHPDVPDEFIGSVFTSMSYVPSHTFQVLTKRPERMASFLSGVATSPQGWLTHNGMDPKGIARGDNLGQIIHGDWPMPNVWLGTSIENDRFVGRADYLCQTPAAVRFVSAEPLLGPLPSLDLTGIDWVIVGGESGPGTRRMDPEWVRDLRDRCKAAGVAFFFKQAGAVLAREWGCKSLKGEDPAEWPEEFQIRQTPEDH